MKIKFQKKHLNDKEVDAHCNAYKYTIQTKIWTILKHAYKIQQESTRSISKGKQRIKYKPLKWDIIKIPRKAKEEPTEQKCEAIEKNR